MLVLTWSQTFNIATLLFHITSLVLIESVDSSFSRPRLPLIEDITGNPKKSRQTQCSFGNDVYDVGEKWKPNIEPFGVFYCILCECVAVRKKNRVVAKVHCRNFKDDCPKPNCDNPVLLPDRCCKTCPGDDDNIEDVIARRKLEEDTLKNSRKEFYAILTEDSVESKQTLTTQNSSQAFIQLKKNRLLFLIQTFGIERPVYVRFQDLENTIVEEYVVYGNTTQTNDYQIYGVWPKMPKIYRIMLRKGQLKMSISFDNDINSQSRIYGKIKKYDHKKTGLVANQFYFNLLNFENDPHKFQNMLNTSSFISLEDKNNLAKKTLSDESFQRNQNSIKSNLKCYYEAQIYEEGAQWKNHNDDCEMCFCQRGRIKCESEMCLKLTCPDQIHIPGHCCPVCKNTANLNNITATQACYFDGDNKHHLVGSKWHPYLPPFGFDKCSTCTCTQNLVINCERSECPPLSCSEHEAYRADSMDCCKRCPNVMPVKSIVSMDHLSDQGFNDEVAMQQIKNQEKLKLGGCRFRGTVYENGDEWNPTVQPFGEMKCVKCKCKNSVHKCRRTECKKLNRCKLIVTKSTECCPICADDNSKLMSNGSSIGGRRFGSRKFRRSFFN